MRTKIAGPTSFTRHETGTRAKRPLVVELPRKVNKRRNEMMNPSIPPSEGRVAIDAVRENTEAEKPMAV